MLRVLDYLWIKRAKPFHALMELREHHFRALLPIWVWDDPAAAMDGLDARCLAVDALRRLAYRELRG